MADTHVHTEGGGGGGGSGGLYAMLIVIVILIIGAVLYFGGIVGPRGDGDTDIDVKVEGPAVPTTQ